MDGVCSTVGEGTEKHACFWWGSMKERDHLEGLSVDGMIKKQNFKLILGNKMWVLTSVIWPNMGTRCGFL